MRILDRASFQSQKRFSIYVGLSTDVKPIDSINNGDEFQEIDTGKIYRFDASGQVWYEQPIDNGGTVIPSVPPKDVNFYDYDGQLLYSYTIAEANLLVDLPQPPIHEGLLFQEWNYSLESVQITTQRLDVGATYITDDGKTRLYITIPANSEPGRPPARNVLPLFISQTVENGVTIDWGDSSPTETLAGTGAVNTNHTYETEGNFVISLSPVDGCDLQLGSGSSSNCVMGFTGTNGLVYCNMLKRVEVGSSVTSIGNYAFYNCYSLSSVVIPDSVTSIENNAFYNCYSLSSVVIPDSVTSIGNNAFYNCRALSSVVIPDSVTSIENFAFYNCYSLSSVVIPDSVTSIGNYAFSYLYGIKECHCKPLTPPTLSSANAFTGIPSDCIIYVPVGSLEDYQTATNWSTYASYMQEEPA